MVEVMKIMVTSFIRRSACTADLSAPNPHLCGSLLDIHGQVWVSLLWRSLLLSPGSWWAQGFVCALQESVSSVLCKFWQLYGGVNADLLQEGLCHTQVCCTQSLCPCGSPLLTCTSSGHTHRQVWLVSVGFPGVHKVLFEPSKCLMVMGFD